MFRQLTPEETLERLKKEAKRWLKSVRANDGDARDRLKRVWPDAPSALSLRDMQYALARELDFPGWSALKHALEAAPPAQGSVEALVVRFLDVACPDHHVRGKPEHDRAKYAAMRLLERHPEIPQHDFITAVVCGEVAYVERALARHPQLATSQSPGRNPYRSMAGAMFDVYHGMGPKGWEPLLYLCFTRLPLAAVTDNAVAIARLLLDHGADPNAHFMAGGSRYTPLVGAIGEGEEHRPPHQQRDALVRLLLDRGAEPYDMQVVYNLGFSGDYLWYLPLIHECSVRLGRQADWEDPEWTMLNMGNYGSGARWLLQKAIENGDEALATWCLAHGANPNAAGARDARFNQASFYEQAVELGHHAIAELLIEYGARRVTRRQTPMEAFIAACLRLDRERVRAAISEHPEYLTNPRPLFAAAERDRADVIEFLIHLGMSPNVENEAHERPLHMAAYNNAINAARSLIARGAEIDAREHHYGNTPLGGAVWHQYHEMIDLLAPLSRDVWELTYIGRVDRLRELFAEDPARARVTWKGSTPLMWLPPHDEAVALEVVRLFLAHGADAAARNEEGATAADRAEALGMLEVAEYLRAAVSRSE